MSVSERAMHQHMATKRRLSFLDRIVIIASFLYPLSASSQVYEVFTGHADGVSPISWSIFLLCASLFLVYGVKHKITPMIYRQFNLDRDGQPGGDRNFGSGLEAS